MSNPSSKYKSGSTAEKLGRTTQKLRRGYVGTHHIIPGSTDSDGPEDRLIRDPSRLAAEMRKQAYEARSREIALSSNMEKLVNLAGKPNQEEVIASMPLSSSRQEAAGRPATPYSAQQAYVEEALFPPEFENYYPPVYPDRYPTQQAPYQASMSRSRSKEAQYPVQDYGGHMYSDDRYLPNVQRVSISPNRRPTSSSRQHQGHQNCPICAQKNRRY